MTSHSGQAIVSVAWIAVVAVLVVSCAPARRAGPPPRQSVEPAVVETPRVRAAPRSPRRLAVPDPEDGRVPRDVTREPLTWNIGPGTPPRVASALRMVERARAELEETVASEEERVAESESVRR